MAPEPRRPEPPFLLDTGAILQGLNLPPTQCVTTPSVMDEIDAKGATGRRAQFLREAGLKILTPDAPARARVTSIAAQTGAKDRLSPTDIDVLALALMHPGTLLSDDYTVLDVARRLNVHASPATTKGIQDGRTWTLRCRGCGRTFTTAPPDETCPVCGSQVAPKPRRTR